MVMLASSILTAKALRRVSMKSIGDTDGFLMALLGLTSMLEVFKMNRIFFLATLVVAATSASGNDQVRQALDSVMTNRSQKPCLPFQSALLV